MNAYRLIPLSLLANRIIAARWSRRTAKRGSPPQQRQRRAEIEVRQAETVLHPEEIAT